jgi:hypothetical protein
MEAITSCEACVGDIRIRTDHVPIVTTLDFYITRTPPKSVANFRDVDWDKFRTELKSQIGAAAPSEPITSYHSLAEECDKLTRALQITILRKVPDRNRATLTALVDEGAITASQARQ